MKKQKRFFQNALAGIICVIIGAGMAGCYWGSNGQTVAAEEITELIAEVSSEEAIDDSSIESSGEEATSEVVSEISADVECTDAIDEEADGEANKDIMSDLSAEEVWEGDMPETSTETENKDTVSDMLTDEDSEAGTDIPEIIDAMPEPVTATVTNWKSPRQFVSRLYEIFLGRPADDAGLEFWAGKLERQEMGAANVAYSIIFSSESRQNNMSDEEFCLYAFSVLLNRNIQDVKSPDAYMKYVRYLQQGLSREYVIQAITNEQDFSKKCFNYGLPKGSISHLSQARDQNPNLTAFINRLYTEALGREGEEGGLNFWCEGLMNKSYSPYTIANFFINSPEFNNKNLSDVEYVKTLYRTFFGREYDQEGLDFWTGKLATGTSKLYVQNFFEHSWEFFNIVSGFGIVSEDELWLNERTLILNSIADSRARAAILYALDRRGYPYSQELRNTGAYYDCSSLIYYSWQYAGVDLRYRGSNTAASMAQGLVASGKQIHATSEEDLQPGDLIFWTGENNNRYMGIWHVSMYMGSGRIVDTPAGNGGVDRSYVIGEQLRVSLESGKWIVCRP